MIAKSACGGRVLNRKSYAMQQAIGGRFTGPVSRSLMYFAWPRGCWKEVTRGILERGHLFEHAIAAVAYDHSQDVRNFEQEFGNHFDEILPVANIKELREVVGWLPCLQRLVRDDPNAVIFAAHAKGVTHPNNPVIRRWTHEMTEINLDYWPAVEQAFQSHAMVGAFRRKGTFPVVAHTSGAQSEYELWHYSGTFYWMRSKDLFHRDWRKMDWKWYGAESYPGVQYSAEQCACLVGDWCGDLYQQATWDELQPQIDEWKDRWRN
jgi:hypothetical protein